MIPRKSKSVFAIATLTFVCSSLLLIVGALVTSTGSSLSVPDWPLSFGQLFPPMVGGVLYEHGHRLIAGSVAILTIFLVVLLLRFETRLWVRRLGIVCLIGVLAQALLGGVTVLFRLPPFVSVAHACLGQLFFCGIFTLMRVTNPRRELCTVENSFQETLFWHSVLLFFLFFGQLFLGAWMRHVGAGGAIPDFPKSFGMWIPPLESVAIGVHYFHRVGALLIFATTLMLTLRVYTSPSAPERLVRVSGALLLLVFIQATLGAVTIWTGRPVWVTTLHLFVGALCLATSLQVVVDQLSDAKYAPGDFSAAMSPGVA